MCHNFGKLSLGLSLFSNKLFPCFYFFFLSKSVLFSLLNSACLCKVTTHWPEIYENQINFTVYFDFDIFKFEIYV